VFALYDFCNQGGDNIIAKWASKEGLTKRDRALLDVKFDSLVIHGVGLIPKLLAAVEHQPGIFKLRVQTTRALRPMLCKGPFNMEAEFTILLGSIEENFKLRPPSSKATENRDALIAGRNRRVAHERFESGA
jgi:hypothetical protein